MDTRRSESSEQASHSLNFPAAMMINSPLLSAPDSVLPVPDLAVIVPVCNEADNILPLIEEIYHALKGRLVFELIYVDDGSIDTTPVHLANARRCHPHLTVLRHRTSCGQSQALLTGIRAARAQWIAVLDGDGQNDPADILALCLPLQAMDANVAARHMIVGWRVTRQDTWSKRVASRLANYLRATLLKDGTPDTGCGLKLFPRSAFLDFPYFDHMHRYLPALMIRAGGQVVSVKVNHRPRVRGRSHYGTLDRLWVGLFDMIGMMWLQRRNCQPEVGPLSERAPGDELR
ncbi:Dolichol-phosphate mannosyltransferase [invertebrate metagenome]|uniref:Dolichol-phosphate mannosyltransferase n=1 Tax=invertebrate metagenome TaxID=1711999 RepID=A0A484H5R4_9ZZZZ